MRWLFASAVVVVMGLIPAATALSDDPTEEPTPDMTTTTTAPVCDDACAAYVTAQLDAEQAAVDEWNRQAEINAAARDGQWLAILAVADRVTDEWDLAWVAQIIDRESNYDPRAENPTSSASGLFQLLDGWAYLLPQSTSGLCPPTHDGGFYDAVCNIHAAAELYTMPGGGPSHWSF